MKKRVILTAVLSAALIFGMTGCFGDDKGKKDTSPDYTGDVELRADGGGLFYTLNGFGLATPLKCPEVKIDGKRYTTDAEPVITDTAKRR